MGSTLETAIVFSSVLLIICAFILLPLNVCGSAFEDVKDASHELDDYYDTSYNAQDFNFMVTGLSENYRLIYSNLGEIADGAN